MSPSFFCAGIQSREISEDAFLTLASWLIEKTPRIAMSSSTARNASCSFLAIFRFLNHPIIIASLGRKQSGDVL